MPPAFVRIAPYSERTAGPFGQPVSAEIGYDDVGFFRSLFKRSTGMTPAEYRAHFAPLNVRGKTAYATA